VARVRDWIDLGKSTISSLSTSDLAGLYSEEWPQTQSALIAEHKESIEQEPKRLHRIVRTVSAIMYGLTKRLAPHRRVLFVISLFAFAYCFFGVARFDRPKTTTALLVSVLILMLLLAMELIDKIRFRDELELARDLQANLIPKHMPQTKDYDLAAFNLIANTVGGDIYDFVPLDDGRLAVLFGDASGHGMAAGLVMAVAHAAFRTQLDIDPSPVGIVASLNRILCRTGGSRSFFACCYVLLSPGGQFLATLAGHPQLLKIDTRGKVAERMGQGAYPLGIKLGLLWETIHGTLAPGEKLLLHSDGLTEARNANDREFGDAYVEAIAGWHPEASATELVATIVDEWRLFMGRRRADDDVSIAVVARRVV
jgi:serine phosphatase RsbU (regulator of sigma subunit)